jgi:hypothetical protein
MLDALRDRCSEVPFAVPNGPVQTFFFDRPHKTFRYALAFACAQA